MKRLIASFFPLLCLIANARADSLRTAPEKVQFSQEQIDASKKIEHVIVLYLENWSFDGLCGKFPGVDGLSQAIQGSVTQVDKVGKPYPVLPSCINTKAGKPYPSIPSTLPNAPFDLQRFLPWTKATGDLIHAYYQEQYQINDGRMNAFATWSDAGGFAMSYYDIAPTRFGKLCREYTICDRFFHSCYGGSMCNVIWLFSAQMPLWPNAPSHLTAILSSEGKMIKDGRASPDGYAINDAEPFFMPYRSGTPKEKRVPPQNYKTIGDLLSEKGISWRWYAQGWEDAILSRSENFTYHYQAPSYFLQFAPGTKARAEHLFDLNDFYTGLTKGEIPAVSFIRPLKQYSQHPAAGPLFPGLEWCADFIERVQNSSVWSSSVIIVTYDENGGRWDHVPPPLIDRFGPGTRVPTFILSPYAKRGFVDHTCYETVSILKFIEERFGLSPLSTRDAEANNLLNAFDFGQE